MLDFESDLENLKWKYRVIERQTLQIQDILLQIQSLISRYFPCKFSISLSNSSIACSRFIRPFPVWGNMVLMYRMGVLFEANVQEENLDLLLPLAWVFFLYFFTSTTIRKVWKRMIYYDEEKRRKKLLFSVRYEAALTCGTSCRSCRVTSRSPRSGLQRSWKRSQRWDFLIFFFINSNVLYIIRKGV